MSHFVSLVKEFSRSDQYFRRLPLTTIQTKLLALPRYNYNIEEVSSYIYQNKWRAFEEADVQQWIAIG